MSNIAHFAYSGIGGLAEVCLTLLASACREHGGDHHCVGFYGVEPLAPRYVERCESLALAYRYFEKRRGIDLSSSEIFGWLRENQPDVVITHMTQTFIPFVRYWMTNPKARLIVVEHHSNALKGPKDWALTAINHWLASATIYLTDQYRDQVKQKLGLLLRDSRVHVIPNGLDTELYSPAADREFGGENLVFGMQGRMVRTKDYGTLLRAFARFRESTPSHVDTRLEIAGDGPMRLELEALAGELGISEAVDFLGMIPGAEMIERMRHWDVLVLSTLGETMSRALMEAQSCGLPVVATNVSGVSAAVLDRETGLLVPAGDVEALSEALGELASDPDFRRRLSENARRLAVASFSADQCWARYCEVIRNVLA